MSEAREVAREAREVAREAREVFAHRANKVKGLLHPPMVLMAILYPVVIGFTLEARGWHFSLSHPRPVADEFKRDPTEGEGDRNQWVTYNAVVFQRTIFSFVSYTVVHIYLLLHMRVVSPRGPRIAARFSWVAPTIFAWVGFTYFYTYASLSRYGTPRADWVAVGAFSGLIALTTLYLVLAPISSASIIEDLDHPAHAAHQE